MSKYNEDLDYLIQNIDISEKELEEIITEADKIISEPNCEKDKSIEAYLKKVQCLQKLKKHTESEEFIDKILVSNPNMPEALVRLGSAYDENKKYDEAIDCITKAIGINPDYAYAYLLRGYTKHSLLKPDYNGAIEDYDKAIELKPDYAVAYNNRGNAKRKLSDYDGAIKDYDKAIEINPQYDMARENRLNAYHAKDEDLPMPLDKIRDNKYHMEELRDNITKVVPFLGAGASKPYGYYTWEELLQQLLDMCCRDYQVPPETKEEIQKHIKSKDYIKAANELDKIYPYISNAVCTLIERVAKANPTKDINVNRRSILSEYLHVFPNKKYLTINYDTVLQDILEIQGFFVNAIYHTSGLGQPKKRKKQDIYDNDLSRMYRKDEEMSEVYYLHGIYDDPYTIVFSESQYDDAYGMPNSDIKNKVQKPLPSEINKLYHSSLFLYIGCGMTVKQDRVLRMMGDIYGLNRNTISYALLNVNEIAKTDELYENWGTQNEEEQEKLNKALDEKEEELKNTMNVRVIWYSAPGNSADGHESAKRQLFKYILDDTRKRFKKEKREKQRLMEEKAKIEAAIKKQERDRLQAEFNNMSSGGDTEGSEITTPKEGVKGISLSEEQLKQVEEFFKDKILMKAVSSTKHEIKFPMYKIEGGLYEIYLVSENGKFYLSDEGTTYAELDKIFELSEPDVIKNLVRILKQYGCRKQQNINSFIIECTLQDVHIKMSYLIQAISFMLNMKIFYV